MEEVLECFIKKLDSYLKYPHWSETNAKKAALAFVKAKYKLETHEEQELLNLYSAKG